MNVLKMRLMQCLFLAVQYSLYMKHINPLKTEFIRNFI
jgi:hypothetical protein